MEDIAGEQELVRNFHHALCGQHEGERSKTMRVSRQYPSLESSAHTVAHYLHAGEHVTGLHCDSSKASGHSKARDAMMYTQEMTPKAGEGAISLHAEAEKAALSECADTHLET